MLTYITSNKDKIATAKRNLALFGIEIETEELDLVEIQTESIKEIAESKAKQAYDMLKKPLFVSDHGWSIPALNGFPGPYMKYINKWFTSEDFLNLMKDHTDKRIIKTEVLCFVNRDEIKTFSKEFQGRFLDEIKGDGLPAMRVVSMLPSGKSVAECNQEGINMSEEVASLWKEFGEWYNSQKS